MERNDRKKSEKINILLATHARAYGQHPRSLYGIRYTRIYHTPSILYGLERTLEIFDCNEIANCEHGLMVRDTSIDELSRQFKVPSISYDSYFE